MGVVVVTVWVLWLGLKSTSISDPVGARHSSYSVVGTAIVG